MLSAAECRVVDAAARGRLCDFGSGDPAKGLRWGPERSIRAQVLYALCCRGDWPVHPKGCRIHGARIRGVVDFEGALLDFPLHLVSCFIGHAMSFEGARVRTLVLSGSRIRAANEGGSQGSAILAAAMESTGDVWLDDRFEAAGEVCLLSARIGGDLICRGGSFRRGSGKQALTADRLVCEGSIYLDRGFLADGRVGLIGARTRGDLYCQGGTFDNLKGQAIQAERFDCHGNVLLSREDDADSEPFQARGEVRLAGASIAGHLDCHEGRFYKPDGDALTAEGLNCKGSLTGGKVEVKGKLRLSNATIRGDLDLHGGILEKPCGTALNADKLVCRGDVYLNQASDSERTFVARGEVRLLGAKLGGDLDCTGGVFDNPGRDDKNRVRDALSADGMDCESNVYLKEGFQAKGGVRLIGASIVGELVLSGGCFESRVETSGNGEVRHVRESGAVGKSRLVAPDGEEAQTEETNPVALDLSGAQVGILIDDPSWPTAGRLVLDGFRYRRIDPKNLEERLRWLEHADFAPQAYEQLAGVLHGHGRREAATEVLIAKNKTRVKYESWPTKLRLRFLGFTVRYGYRPGRAVLWLLLPLIIGIVLFRWASAADLMAPTSTTILSTQSWQQNREIPAEYADYPRFSSPLYALDTLIPVVNLHMEQYWEPSLAPPSPRAWGVSLPSWVPWLYLRLHIVGGWLLTTLAVLGFTGIVRLK